MTYLRRTDCGVWMCGDTSLARTIAEYAMRAMKLDVNDFRLRDAVIVEISPVIGIAMDTALQMSSTINSDDPITEDWLKSIGFTQSKPCHVHGTPDCNWWHNELRLEIGEYDTGLYRFVDFDRVAMKTRGHLQMLIDWIKKGD